jgi:hypothetical protein
VIRINELSEVSSIYDYVACFLSASSPHRLSTVSVGGIRRHLCTMLWYGTVAGKEKKRGLVGDW